MGFDIDWSAQVSHAMVPEPLGEQNATTEYQPGQKDVLFGEDGFTFSDLLDVINPLQHIPVISSIYRALTGDTIDAAPRVLGGALFGGPIGAASAFVNAVVDETTGKDLGEHVMALFTGDDEPDEGVEVAKAAPAAAATNAGAEADAVEHTELPPPPSEAKASKPSNGEDAAAIAAMPVAAGSNTPAPTALPQILASLRHPAFDERPAPATAPATALPASAIPASRPGRSVSALGDIRHPRFDAVDSAGAALAATSNPAAAVTVLNNEQRAANDWLYDAMKRGLDKYESSAHLAESQTGPSRSVVR